MIIKLMTITIQESEISRVPKKDKDGNYFDARQMVIKNTETYYDGLYVIIWLSHKDWELPNSRI